MNKKVVKYASASTVFYFNSAINELAGIVDKSAAFIITDDNVYHHHQKKLKGWNVILVRAGEEFKNQQAVDEVIVKLIESGADRKSTIIGLGGGVVTDIAGYVASVYLRGVSFGFIPTSILAMVDASIGGKNGVDVGIYKNMVGVIRQPKFLLYDYTLLKTLPQQEWINGFAEIIKHAAIKDAAMFKLLESHTVKDFRKDKQLLDKLIQRNALLKARVVQQDELEQGDRKLLNFGHTLGHAIENTYKLPHGHAISVGMVFAAYLSKQLLDFKAAERLVRIIEKYGLTTFFNYDAADALNKMLSDKKRVNEVINFVLLEKIGKALYQPLKLEQIASVMEAVNK